MRSLRCLPLGEFIIRKNQSFESNPSIRLQSIHQSPLLHSLINSRVASAGSLNFLFERRGCGTTIRPRFPRTLINPDATRYPWTRIPAGACTPLTNTRALITLRLACVTENRVADEYRGYNVTVFHYQSTPDALCNGSFPCILHQSAGPVTRLPRPPDTLASHHLASPRFCISSSFMRPGFGFRPYHSAISPYALPRDSAESRNTL